ncbi:MAG: hypothetical protein L6Q98_22090 [Anaerolineae bacterium]|nr:hypothetical protein [Anaerolineae bacterium]NUQ05421.1 hypothetical protein [Anaerolineae bacterium]
MSKFVLAHQQDARDSALTERTPAMAVGLTDRIYSLSDLLLTPLYPTPLRR